MSETTTKSTIDLSQVDSENTEELAKRIESYYRNDTTAKSSLSYHWEKNHLFLDGKQWIVYDGERTAGGKWKALSVSKANEYVPRPVTNYIMDVYQTLKAYLIQNQPRISIRPNTQTNKDKQAAKLAEIVAETNWAKLHEEANFEYAASCAIVYGTVFKKDYWDNSTAQMVKVPRMETVPTTDPATGQVTGQQEREAIDPQTGQPIFDMMPLGDVNTAVVEPYRLAIDPLCTDLHNARWIMEYAIQPIDWIKEIYGKEEPGYTGEALELEEEKSLSSEMQRFTQLKTSSGVRSSGVPAMNNKDGTDDVLENSVVLKEYYERPSQKYPKGRLIAVANNKTLYAGDSPYEGPESGDWHPFSEFRWERVPGRFWGKSPLDDATEIQKTINSIDAVIVLTRKTMAIPQKLIPNDSGIKPGEWTGRPGAEIRYRPSGQLPSTVPASGVDGTVFQERQQKMEDLKAVTGAIDILKGDRPAGVTAASALEMLFEVGTGKLRPALNRWKRFVEMSQKKQLRVVSKFYREPRPEFIRMLHARNKEIPVETINAFIGADLYDNCNVHIEAGANIPKLQSAEKALLLQLAQVGSLNLDNPENKLEFNRRMGITGFDNEVGPDVRRAEWENDLMDDAQYSPDNKPVVLADENHALHVETHLRRMKEPSFLSMPSAVQQLYMQHLQEHQQYQDMQKQQAQQEAALTGQPPAPPEQPAHGLHPAGKGITHDMQSQLMSDIPKV